MLWQRYQGQLTQLERLTTISDGYQALMRDQGQSLTERYRKQIRSIQKIVRISDQYQEMQRDLTVALRVASTHDALTNLPNRRLMLDRLRAEAALSVRQGPPFSLALIDVDHFKEVNDKFGHNAGDAVLVALAHTLTGTLRTYDVCARWGGEEFLVLLPSTSGAEALTVGNRLRAAVATLSPREAPEANGVKLSIGVAEHVLTAELDETIKRADQALYRAKATGRDRVVLAD